MDVQKIKKEGLGIIVVSVLIVTLICIASLIASRTTAQKEMELLFEPVIVEEITKVK